MGDVRNFPGGLMQLADVATEEGVLGALINGEGHPMDCREEIIEIFGKQAHRVFTTPVNQQVYQSFLSCLIRGTSTGPHGITDMLREEGDLSEDALGLVYRLSGAASGPVEAVNGAKIILNLHRRRMVSGAMEDGARQVRSGEQDCDVAISDAFSSVAKAVEEGDEPDSRYERGRLVEEGLGVILGLRSQVMGMSYGMKNLDERTTGMHRGHMTAVGARSGGGKTVFGGNVARDIAIKQGIPAVIFSLEMTPGDLLQRAASAELRIPYSDILKNSLTSEQREAVGRFADNEYQNKNFRIEYCPGATAGELYLLARKSVRDMGAQFFVVDYAQSVNSDKGTTEENAKMSETIPRIHEIAQNLDVHVLLMSQLKKVIQGREDEAAGVNDLLYGTKIENSATTIWVLHRRLVEGKPGSEVDAHAVKNRLGMLGQEELVFDGARQRFLAPGMRMVGEWNQQ